MKHEIRINEGRLDSLFERMMYELYLLSPQAGPTNLIHYDLSDEDLSVILVAESTGAGLGQDHEEQLRKLGISWRREGKRIYFWSDSNFSNGMPRKRISRLQRKESDTGCGLLIVLVGLGYLILLALVIFR